MRRGAGGGGGGGGSSLLAGAIFAGGIRAGGGIPLCRAGGMGGRPEVTGGRMGSLTFEVPAWPLSAGLAFDNAFLPSAGTALLGRETLEFTGAILEDEGLEDTVRPWKKTNKKFNWYNLI